MSRFTAASLAMATSPCRIRPARQASRRKYAACSVPATRRLPSPRQRLLHLPLLLQPSRSHRSCTGQHPGRCTNASIPTASAIPATTTKAIRAGCLPGHGRPPSGRVPTTDPRNRVPRALLCQASLHLHLYRLRIHVLPAPRHTASSCLPAAPGSAMSASGFHSATSARDSPIGVTTSCVATTAPRRANAGNWTGNKRTSIRAWPTIAADSDPCAKISPCFSCCCPCLLSTRLHRTR